MIGWGIFLIICGLAGLEDGSGAIFLIIGIIIAIHEAGHFFFA